MADLHDRMPVVLAGWRLGSLAERRPRADRRRPSRAAGLLQPTDDVALRIYAVNRYVNDVRRDGPELIEPLLETAVGAAAEGTLGF